jgi:hypothetical protein
MRPGASAPISAAMTRRLAWTAVAAAAAATALAGCGGGRQAAGVCANADGALSKTAFVFVQTPTSGERVSSGFRVAGCSSTFEANVTWRLLARDGRLLAEGFTQGGSLEPGPFEFTVSYSIGARQVGRLEVVEPRVTTEGFPPVRNVLPLVLEP